MTDRECGNSGTEAPAEHGASRGRIWKVFVLAVMLIAAHGLLLYYAWFYLRLM